MITNILNNIKENVLFLNTNIFFFYRKMVLVLEQPAPKFKGTAVVNGEFKDISLESFKGKYVVLFFYPLDL